MRTGLIKYIISIILIYFISMLINWWRFCIITFSLGLLSKSFREALLAGSLCPSFVWLSILIYNYFNNGDILISKIALMFGFPNQLSLVLASIAIPFSLGSVSSITGYQFRRKND